MSKIKKVAVIGAGLMGSGIAAHVANAGINVLLLDIVPENADNRNILVENALKNIKSSKPASLMHPSLTRHISIGNLGDIFAIVSPAQKFAERRSYKTPLHHLSACLLFSQVAKTLGEF